MFPVALALDLLIRCALNTIAAPSRRGADVQLGFLYKIRSTFVRSIPVPNVLSSLCELQLLCRVIQILERFVDSNQNRLIDS